MNVEIPEWQIPDLASLAARTGRTPDSVVLDAVDRYLEEEAWFENQVQVALDQMARGEFIEEEAMEARVARMLAR